MLLLRIPLSKQAVVEQVTRVHEVQLLLTHLDHLCRAVSLSFSLSQRLHNTWLKTGLYLVTPKSPHLLIPCISYISVSHLLTLQQKICLGHISLSRKWLHDPKSWINSNKVSLCFRSLSPNVGILLGRSHLISFTGRINILSVSSGSQDITQRFLLSQDCQRRGGRLSTMAATCVLDESWGSITSSPPKPKPFWVAQRLA